MPKPRTAKIIPRDIPTAKNFINLTGSTFGNLTVTQYAGRDHSRKSYWKCQCSCGNTTVVSISNLKSGRTQSCGCLHIESVTIHGESQTPEYYAWRALVDRCTNPKSSAYHNYGGRGITVCKQWLSYNNFLADMGRRPSANHSLDRIDNDGPYSPDNCQWTTRLKQARNTRSNRYITYNGETLTVSEWARKLGIPAVTLHARIFRYKWPIEKAFTTPIDTRKRSKFRRAGETA